MDPLLNPLGNYLVPGFFLSPTVSKQICINFSDFGSLVRTGVDTLTGSILSPGSLLQRNPSWPLRFDSKSNERFRSPQSTLRFVGTPHKGWNMHNPDKRTVLKLNQNWFFMLGDLGAGFAISVGSSCGCLLASGVRWPDAIVRSH